MNKKQQFFVDKSIYFAEEIYKRADKVLLKQLQNIKINKDVLLRRVADLMLKYKVVDSVLKLDNKALQIEFKKISVIVNEMLEAEYEDEKGVLNDLLITVGTDRYYTNCYLISKCLDFELKVVTNKELDKIINSKIKEEDYSERIYKNKVKDVAYRLKKDLKGYLEGKVSVNDIEKALQKDFLINANNTKRLFATEVAKVQEGANSVWREKYNIEYVMYLATLDNDSCKVCGKYDGKVFKNDETPVNLPQHPNCRCTYVALPDEKYKPLYRLDNNTKKDIDFDTYEKWKEKNGL